MAFATLSPPDCHAEGRGFEPLQPLVMKALVIRGFFFGRTTRTGGGLAGATTRRYQTVRQVFTRLPLNIGGAGIASLTIDEPVSSPTTVAHIKPEVLRWARESAGFSLRRAADAIGVEKWRLELTEDGGELLTLRQAERAAEVYERPLAALFMPQVPEEDDQEVQFRRLPGTPEPPWGPEVQLAARRVTERQQIALEIYEDPDEAPPWIESSAPFVGGQGLSLPEIVRDVLGVP
jgi:transcriptional regulator with XRE-family HTH domain